MRVTKPSPARWIGELPSTWSVAPLYARYSVQLGKMLNPAATAGEQQAPYLGNGDVQWGKVDVSDLATMSFNAVERKRFRLRHGDLLVCEGGDVGRTAVWRDEVPECFYQKALHRLRPRTPVDDPQFFFYVMRTATELGVFEEGGNKTTFTHLTGEKLRSHRFPFPPLDEQRAIATFLDRKTAAIDALIANKERLFGLLQEKRQATITQAVTKGLVPNVPMKESGTSWFDDVPAHWEIRRLKRISPRLQGRLVVQPHLYFAEEGVPIVFGYNIKNGVIEESGLSRISFEADAKHRHAKVRSGDVLTVRLGDPGMSAVVPPSLDGCHFASIMWIHQHPRFDSHWLCHCMNSRPVQAQIEAVNYGAAQTQFNIEDAVDFILPFPPVDEQRRIAAHINAELQKLRLVEGSLAHQLSSLREYRQALITAAVTGKLDITKPPEAA